MFSSLHFKIICTDRSVVFPVLHPIHLIHSDPDQNDRTDHDWLQLVLGIQQPLKNLDFNPTDQSWNDLARRF